MVRTVCVIVVYTVGASMAMAHTALVSAIKARTVAMRNALPALGVAFVTHSATA
jgi:hypothetical protein